MYFHLLFKKRRIYSSVLDFAWKVPRQRRLKNRITYKAGGKKKQKKKREKRKKKKAVSLLGKEDFRWEYAAGSSWTGDQPNPVLFPQSNESPVPIQVPGIPKPEAFCPRERCFFRHKGWHRTPILKALWCGWLGCLRPGLGIRHRKAQLLGICRQHVAKAGAVQQLGHLTRLMEKGEERDGGPSPALSGPLPLYWGTPEPTWRPGACCRGGVCHAH